MYLFLTTKIKLPTAFQIFSLYLSVKHVFKKFRRYNVIADYISLYPHCYISFDLLFKTFKSFYDTQDGW